VIKVTHNNHSRAFYDLLTVKLPKWQDVKTEMELKFLSKRLQFFASSSAKVCRKK
jgi:predicted metal-dependent hydrolase